VLYGGDLDRAATRTVFRTAGVVAPGETTRPWVDELGNLLTDDEVTAFVPADAEELLRKVGLLTHQLDKLQRAHDIMADQRDSYLQIMARVAVERNTARGDVERLTVGLSEANDARMTMLAELERIRAAHTSPKVKREELADAWEAGYEARDEWTPVGPTGIPHDPPLNPHDETRPTP
jgi:hypothetical protein